MTLDKSRQSHLQQLRQHNLLKMKDLNEEAIGGIFIDAI
jgi:hypothetical protein